MQINGREGMGIQPLQFISKIIVGKQISNETLNELSGWKFLE